MLLLVNYLLLFLLIVYHLCIWSFFFVHYLVSFLVLQSFRWGREKDGCLKIAFNVMGLFVLCVSTARCNGLVCSVSLGYFLAIFYLLFFHAILDI